MTLVQGAGVLTLVGTLNGLRLMLIFSVSVLSGWSCSRFEDCPVHIKLENGLRSIDPNSLLYESVSAF